MYKEVLKTFLLQRTEGDEAAFKELHAALDVNVTNPLDGILNSYLGKTLTVEIIEEIKSKLSKVVFR